MTIAHRDAVKPHGYHLACLSFNRLVNSRSSVQPRPPAPRLQGGVQLVLHHKLENLLMCWIGAKIENSWIGSATIRAIAQLLVLVAVPVVTQGVQRLWARPQLTAPHKLSSGWRCAAGEARTPASSAQQSPCSTPLAASDKSELAHASSLLSDAACTIPSTMPFDDLEQT